MEIKEDVDLDVTTLGVLLEDKNNKMEVDDQEVDKPSLFKTTDLESTEEDKISKMKAISTTS